jgi:hypothetical protein
MELRGSAFRGDPPMKDVSRLGSLFLVAVTLTGCGMTVYRPPEAQKEIDYPNELTLNGLAFFDGKLYATSSQGILEFDQGRFSGLCRWRLGRYKVIGSQGPWPNRTDGSVWFKEDYADFLIRRDASGWSSIPMPEPHGDDINPLLYSIGRFSEQSDRRGLWFSSKLETWRWDWNGRRWLEENLPPVTESVQAVAPMGKCLLAVLRNQSSAFSLYAAGEEFKSDDVFIREEGREWRRLTPKGGGFAAGQVVAVPGAAFIRTWGRGEVLQAGVNTLVRIDVPGPCEALAVSTAGELLASFRDQGIFRYSEGNGWTQLYPCPCPPTQQKQHAFLAEDGGTVAFAISAWRTSGSGSVSQPISSLWISHEGRLEKVVWGP